MLEILFWVLVVVGLAVYAMVSITASNTGESKMDTLKGFWNDIVDRIRN